MMGRRDALAERLEKLRRGRVRDFDEKLTQLGSYGGGNHFGECEVVRDRRRASGPEGGGCVWPEGGQRGVSFALRVARVWDITGQRPVPRAAEQFFETWGIPLPGEDKELVYAPLGTAEADAYLDDMALGAQLRDGQPSADQRAGAGGVCRR